MRTIEALAVEKIGDQLCLIFKADDSRHRGILGAISLHLVREAAASFSEAAEAFTPHKVEEPDNKRKQYPIRDFLKK